MSEGGKNPSDAYIKSEEARAKADHIPTPVPKEEPYAFVGRTEFDKKMERLEVIDLGTSPAYLIEFPQRITGSVEDAKEYVAWINMLRTEGIISSVNNEGKSIAGFALSADQLARLESFAIVNNARLSFGLPMAGDHSRLTFDPKQEDPDICALSSSILGAARGLDSSDQISYCRLDSAGEAGVKTDPRVYVTKEDVTFPTEPIQVPEKLLQPYDIESIQDIKIKSAWVLETDLNNSTQKYMELVTSGKSSAEIDMEVKKQFGPFSQIKDELSKLFAMHGDLYGGEKSELFCGDLTGDSVRLWTNDEFTAAMVGALIDKYYNDALHLNPVKSAMQNLQSVDIYTLGNRIIGSPESIDLSHGLKKHKEEKMHPTHTVRINA